MKTYLHTPKFKNLLMVVHVYLCLTISTFGQQNTNLLVGASDINITPESPVIMSGYANRDKPFDGVHDEIFARALVFDNGVKQVCIIQADLIGFSHEFSDEVAKSIEKKTGIPASNIMLVAAHNHGGPSTRVYGDNPSKELDKYIKQLKSSLVEVVVSANTKKGKAETGFGVGTCTMNINRRARQADGTIWLGRNPDGPRDTDVAVMKIINETSETKAMLVNWPCHATTGGQDNKQITGDWPGAAARFVQNKSANQFPVAITAGASGDINPIYGPNNKFGDIEAIGMLLGEEIISVADKIITSPSNDLQIVRRELMVPGKERGASRNPNEKIIPGDQQRLTLTVLKVGHVVYVGISGELMTEIGMNIKNNSPYKNTVILTHCNGSTGYLVTDQALKEGGYEPMVSKCMPGTADIIIKNSLEMIDSL